MHHRKLERETLASNHRLLGLARTSSHWGLLHLQPELVHPSAILSSSFSLATFLSTLQSLPHLHLPTPTHH